jgi:hypothetical protein
LNSLKEQINKKFAWHVVLYEIDASLRRLKNLTTLMTRTDFEALLVKVEDWQSRLEKTKSA